ncbi:MAG: hypothetical protein A3I66_01325 [Burkholderiales bacterium RIFCSPLOWO2_02_FULL_57_36]|nr:MAG: hypothetical protein A3I66_01325 [Burkholderiales bacterium RIFCSPLOWO2_02_FULL_57_36]
MAGTKKRNKRYVPRLADEVKLKAQPWKVAAVFNPLIAILDQLEQHGTIDETTSGQAIFKNVDGEWFDSTAAILGVVEAYEIHETRTGRLLGLDPLRQLANKLQYGMSIFANETEACRACLSRMKAETIEMTAGYARDLIKDFQIKEELLREAV